MNKLQIRRLTITAAVTLALALASGCTNPEVPQGFEGYIYNKPLVFGKMEFRKSLRGPATTGASWRLYTTNVDMRAKSYKEDFQLLTSDNLSVSFEVNTRIKLRDKSVKEIVEVWGGSDWYEWNAKQQLRTIVREQVTLFSATDIQLETPKVKELISQQLLAKFDGTPIIIESVDIGQIQFPSQVADAISLKIAKKQELERQQYVLAKATKEAAIGVLGALRVAKQQMIISSTLDPLYVQQRAVQVYRTIGQSKNRAIIVLPNMPEGTGMPQVLTEGKRKVLTADDEKLLAEMEKRYMAEARKPTVVDPIAPLGGLAVPPDGTTAPTVPEAVTPEAGATTPVVPAPVAPAPVTPTPVTPTP